LDNNTTSVSTLGDLYSYSETSLHSLVKQLQLQVMQEADNDIQVTNYITCGSTALLEAQNFNPLLGAMCGNIRKYSANVQGVVTQTSPVEAFATGIKMESSDQRSF